MLDSSSSSPDHINARIAARVSALRAQRELTLDALATKCNVSRSMISLIERGESSPTAAVLEKLATGLGVPLAALFEDPRPDASPLVRRNAQLQWRDPESGYVRRNVSPPDFRSPIQIVEVVFPPGGRVAYDTGAREVSIHQQVWVLEGAIELTLGDELHRLEQGDCLAMQLDRPTVYRNPHRKPGRYIVVITTDASPVSRR